MSLNSIACEIFRDIVSVGCHARLVDRQLLPDKDHSPLDYSPLVSRSFTAVSPFCSSSIAVIDGCS